MHQLPFALPGRFWKGNLHTHCTRSDGVYAVEDVCRRYQDAGYDFLAITDHFLPAYNYPITDTRALRTPNFTTIIGAELHTDQTELGERWHILAVGLPFDFAPPTEDESAAHMAARARAAGAYVAIAHPAWYALTERDIEALGMVDAIEVFNGVAYDHNDHADSWQIADIMLGRGHRYKICATDDFHGQSRRHDFARGWVQVKSAEATPEALLAALKAGHYYASTGPQIYDIQITPGDKALVRCSPANLVLITGKGSKAVTARGNGEIHFELDLAKFNSPYCRVTVRDAYGGRAWSNPIWF
ncbi:MAG: CehA/McbA family metallohydrolase [Caldilineaceae bacterium]